MFASTFCLRSFLIPVYRGDLAEQWQNSTAQNLTSDGVIT